MRNAPLPRRLGAILYDGLLVLALLFLSNIQQQIVNLPFGNHATRFDHLPRDPKAIQEIRGSCTVHL